ncbi:MAG: hypothetical protein WBD47_02600, partial [Phormidesmis sp.]
MKILVVESVQTVASLLKSATFGHSCQVDTAADGVAGLQWAHENGREDGKKNGSGKDQTDQFGAIAYDLIILDAALPEPSGLPLCQQFRAKGIHTPILLLVEPADSR